MNNILIIDKDEIYSEMSRIILEKHGFNTFIAHNGNDALDIFEANKINVIITEVEIGDMDFFELSNRIREKNEKPHFIIHTHIDNTETELRAVQEGIYAYQNKAKAYKLFLSRVLTLKKQEIVELHVEGYTIDVNRKIAKKDNKHIQMTRLEIDLLEYFALNKNKVLSREKILKKIWATNGSEKYTRVVDTHIKAIRAKLGLKSINTIRGIGYELASGEV